VFGLKGGHDSSLRSRGIDFQQVDSPVEKTKTRNKVSLGEVMV
jgi:hypothetical protein